MYNPSIAIAITAGGKQRGNCKEPPAHQSTLFGSTKNTNQKITASSVPDRYMRTEILLLDVIYNGRVPKDAKGKKFLYIVLSYVQSERFTIKYGKQCIEPGSGKFVAYYKKDYSEAGFSKECSESLSRCL